MSVDRACTGARIAHRVMGNFRESPRTRGSRVSTPPQPALQRHRVPSGPWPPSGKTGWGVHPASQPYLTQAARLYLEPYSCKSFLAGSQLLPLLPLVLDLVAKSLCLAQRKCLSWGLESSFWAWSFSCIPFSILSHSSSGFVSHITTVLPPYAKYSLHAGTG